jgi:UDP-N-acetylglucosamine 2-epimerase (non-hydrolysing)
MPSRPDVVIVYGDVNSTLAATLAAVKLGIPVAHVEAGLRSGDRSMPEEINRLVTDRLSALLFTPSDDGDRNLIAEGVEPGAIKLVGNVMIDTLVRLLPLTDPTDLLRKHHLLNGGGPRPYVLVTLHRPSNVDDEQMLAKLISALDEIGRDVPVLFPMHPRTKARMDRNNIPCRNVLVTEPLTYLEFLGCQRHAALVITDSGGIQEETTYLGVPCLTMRENTERPITVSVGTNELLGRETTAMRDRAREILGGKRKQGSIPPLWDGRASERIAECFVQ